MPAFATIRQVQSNATWGAANTTTCTVTLTNTTRHNLIVVWTTWSPSRVTVSQVVDQNNNSRPLPNAVGPTVQSASNTAGQIVYQNDIHGISGPDKVVVTFNGTTTTASCVAVEYSGADQNYPLDSVSAGYSTSGNPTALLDSGAVAPAHSNLLLFAGGTIDTAGGTAVAGNNFTAIQSHGGSITEQNTNPITGNNVLQRATAGLLAKGSGNWLMQIAVFRDASWTVANAWSPARIGNVRWADQFPGVDIGDQINHAYADCPAAGCVIKISGGSYSFSTPVVFGSLAAAGIIDSGKPVVLDCGGGSNGYYPTNGAVQLNYTGTTGAAITFNDGGFTGAGMKGCNLLGRGSSNSTAGLVCGATSGMYGIPSGDNGVCEGHYFEANDVSAFGVGVMIGGLAFLNTFTVMGVHDNGQNLTLTGRYGNESNKFIGGVLSNQQAVFIPNCVDTSLATQPYDMEFIGVSLDGCGVNINGNAHLAGGHRFRFIGSHLENPNGASKTPFITIGSTCSGCFLELLATDVQEHGTAAGRQGLIVINNTSTANVGIHGGRFYPAESVPIIYVSRGYNNVAVHDVETNGKVTADVNNALSYSSMEYGSVQLGGGAALKIRDQGTCTISSGTCEAQTLGHTYNTAPICIVTWSGNCSGAPRCASSNNQVTPSSSNGSDACTANWIVFGN